jgi:hypothetical protein
VDSSNSRTLTLIVVAAIVFFVGRLFQRTMDTWAGWGKAVKLAAEAAEKIPDAKSAALKAAFRMAGVGLITLIVLAAAVSTIRHI